MAVFSELYQDFDKLPPAGKIAVGVGVIGVAIIGIARFRSGASSSSTPTLGLTPITTGGGSSGGTTGSTPTPTPIGDPGGQGFTYTPPPPSTPTVQPRNWFGPPTPSAATTTHVVSSGQPVHTAIANVARPPALAPARTPAQTIRNPGGGGKTYR